MKNYDEKQSQPLKWFVALIIFILTMTITFADVYGLGVPPSKYNAPPPNQITNSSQNTPPGTFDQDFDSYNSVTSGAEKSTVPPSTIPEPASMILLGIGLAALHLAKRRKF